MPPGTFVPRPRLTRALDLATTRAVTLLVAPAGSGKTATLAAWAAEADRDVRWMAVRGHEPSATLADALLAAAGEEPDPGSPPLAPAEVVDRLVRSTGAVRVLVVDDAHRLSAASWQLLDDVLTYAPDRIRVILATRRDAPLPIVGLELSHGLTTLRADALRFDDAEAAQLVAAHSRDITEADLHVLLKRADGWAAALVLGARRLAGAGDRTAARSALTHTDQPVLDYLLGDVFATLPAATRHVLLCTAHEQEISEDAAVLLSADEHAGDRLAGLAAEGLLVTRYADTDLPAWHYHPLLQELLRRQVALEGPDHALAVAAHARAARHYAVHGPLPAAVRHAAAGHEWELLGQLLVTRGVALIVSGHEDLLDDALAALPDDATSRAPALYGVAGLMRRSQHRLEEAMNVAGLASQAAADTRAGVVAAGRHPTSAELALLADSATLNAWLARYGWRDAAEAVAEATRVLRGGPPPDAGPDGLATTSGLEPARLAWLLHELAVLETWAGSLPDAERHAGEALLTAQVVGLHRLEAASQADRAVLQVLQGQFQTAAETARACLASAAVAGSFRDGYLGRPFLALGWAAFYDVRMDEARAALTSLQQAEEHTSDPLVATLGLVLGARLEAERGNVTGSRRLLATPPPRPEPAPAYLQGIFAVVRAYWAMVAGDLAEVQQQLPTLAELDWRVSEGSFRSVVLDLAGDAAGALRLLDDVLAMPAEGEQVVCSVFAAAYSARLHLRAGRRPQASRALREALTRAAPQRLLHPLLTGLGAGADGTALLAELAAGPGAEPFASYALDGVRRYRAPYPDVLTGGSAGDLPQPRFPTTPGLPAGGQAEPTGRAAPHRPHPAASDGDAVALPPQRLTGREAQVLRELSLGGSYADIALTLYVTENTVKTHVSSLYRKLGVERRADALRRARDLHLL